MSILASLRAFRAKRGRPASFSLLYEPPQADRVIVGQLDFDGQTWTFRYDEAFRRRPDLRPIEGFPDLRKVYQSSVLFPFFAMRIPDTEREDVKRKLDDVEITDPGVSDLLRIFGRRAVSSPSFELVPLGDLPRQITLLEA